MKAYAGFKYRIYPNAQQEAIIKQTIGCCRFVYNHFLDEALAVYKKKKFFPYTKFHVEALPALEEANPFLKEVDHNALVDAINRLGAAEKRFKEVPNTGLPKKKRKGHGGTFKVPRPALRGNLVTVPGLGEIKCIVSRPPEGRILSGLISMTASGKYYISLICSFFSTAKANTGRSVGVDLGIEEFAVTSDGYNFPNEHLYSQELKRLRRLQKAFSRKMDAAKSADGKKEEHKGNNLTKNRLQIARLHEQIKNQMHDSIQKATTRLVEEYDTICIENIDVSALREDKNYSRDMMDVLFFEFRRELEYKTMWYGKTLVVVSGEDGAAVTPHPATVEGAKRLLEQGLAKVGKPAPVEISFDEVFE